MMALSSGSKHDESTVALHLVRLSSGEQHELVLAYDLLFKVKEKSLVLIDEPELSLASKLATKVS